MAEARARGGQGRPPLLGWLGWAGLDAVGRLALLTGSTFIFTRLVGPRDFGVAALALTIVTTAAIFVGAPFEEALTQRRRLRAIDLRAALGASMAIGVAILALSVAAAPVLGDAYGEPRMRWLLPAAMTQIFFSGHSDIATALARRLRRFNDVAFATLCGHVVGVAASLAIAFAGEPLWGLAMQRPLIMLVRALVLQRRLPFLVTPVWSLAHASRFGRFAGMSFMARLIENLSFLLFNNIVGAVYGLATLGQFNMAMRFIEPVRGAVAATSHNLAFSFFARAGHDPERLRALAGRIVAQAALATTPIFVGLAALAPRLLPLLAGPGWDEAAHIAVCLSLGAALAAPAGLVFTTFSAMGRPDKSVASLTLSVVGSLAALAALAPLGPISVGLSRALGDALRAGFAILTSSGALGWTRGARAASLRTAWLLSAWMGTLVVFSTDFFAALPPALIVAAMTVLGLLSYAALLALAAREALAAMRAHLPSRFRPKAGR